MTHNPALVLNRFKRMSGRENISSKDKNISVLFVQQSTRIVIIRVYLGVFQYLWDILWHYAIKHIVRNVI